MHPLWRYISSFIKTEQALWSICFCLVFVLVYLFVVLYLCLCAWSISCLSRTRQALKGQLRKKAKKAFETKDLFCSPFRFWTGAVRSFHSPTPPCMWLKGVSTGRENSFWFTKGKYRVSADFRTASGGKTSSFTRLLRIWTLQTTNPFKFLLSCQESCNKKIAKNLCESSFCSALVLHTKP